MKMKKKQKNEFRILFILLAVVTVLAFFFSNSNAADYAVKKGDTVSSIAKKLGVTSGHIREANGLAGDRIIAGQKLVYASPEEIEAALDFWGRQFQTQVERSKGVRRDKLLVTAEEVLGALFRASEGQPLELPASYVLSKEETAVKLF